MHMRHRTLWISGAALVAVGLTATAAFAANRGAAGSQRASSTATWSVSASFDTEGGDKWVLTDSATGAKITCGVAQPTFGFTQAMGVHGRIGTVTVGADTFVGCALPDGTAISLTATHPWLMMGVKFNPARNLGVTSGNFTGVNIGLSSSGCSGVLDGTAAGADNGKVMFQYYNNPGFLFARPKGNLHIYHVSGCSGLFSTGDSFTVSYETSLSGVLFTSP